MSQGDDHIRGIKLVLQNTFPNITGAVSATQTELDYTVVGTLGTAEASKVVTSDAAGLTKSLVLDEATCKFADAADQTKDLFFELTGATSGFTMTIASSQDADYTLTLPNATDTLVGKTTNDTLTNKTLDDPVVTGAVTEEVFAVTGTTPALSPGDGTIQTWTLTGNSTPTAGTWSAGQSMTLMIDDGTAYTITWTTVNPTWVNNGGVAPTLATTGYTVIVLWKVGSTIYGALVGDGT